MDVNEAGLVDFLAEQAQRQWDEDEQPYLLSLVATDLKLQQVDYRAILGDERLKAFIERTVKDGRYKLVAHPQQKAKVGIIPADKEFAFSPVVSSQTAAEIDVYGERPSSREQVVLGFLRALARLPDSDLEGVVLPAKVLAKLIGRR